MGVDSEIWITLFAMIHIWLVVRFCVLHTFRQANNRPYHLKWLMLVFFLPIIGYALYFWLTRRYVPEES
ncbi:PLDc N-terminal domain-containing protein [Chitinophaga cymbidii]|uniref:Cardiolipin synthase N-terminal domain-containing protein n=1 Tax=Chitinophaga cymbidii TaxID=1096750 RepID=A0A512RSU8_9BACT|nr:PLDc N-terminal domain-containing protein [Chitinophaga cymbidii]GEP98765.1 hypothetical protein CCY01nite_50250 [Chitinophaga cymbidii]